MRLVWITISLCLGALVGFLCGLLRFDELNMGVAQFGAMISVFATLWLMAIGEAIQKKEN